MNFFKGTYGFDILSLFLVILSSLLSFSHFTNLIGLVLLLFVIYRAFSKNYSKRLYELNKFKDLVNKILGKFNKKLPPYLPNVSLEHLALAFTLLKNKLFKKKNYKILKCPKCGQKLRVPRIGKKIVVTCKMCHTEFKAKS